jgi:hypothetical protein
VSSPAEPPDPPDADSEPRDGTRTSLVPQLIVLTVVTVLALLLLGAFALYLTWQHPSLIGPIGAAAATITVPLTVIGVVIALTKR